jgi:hypothetical protein
MQTLENEIILIIETFKNKEIFLHEAASFYRPMLLKLT